MSYFLAEEKDYSDQGQGKGKRKKMSQQEAIIMSLQQQVDRLQGDKKHLEEKVEYLKRVGTTFRSRVISMLEGGQTASSIESSAAAREAPSHSSLAPSDTEQETFFSMVSADTTPAKAQQVHRMLEENQTLTKKVETLKESVSYWRDQATREARSPSPTSHSHSKGKRGVGLVLRSSSDDQMKALRRKNAALTGKVAQLEENRDREFAIKEEVINSLQSQLSDAKLVATSCEQDALAHQASTSELKKQNVELSHRCHMLEGQLVTLKKELEIMVNTAQRGAMRQDPSTGREAEVRPLHDSLTELRKTVRELNKKLELESTLRKAAEKRIVALQDEFALMAKLSETQRSTTTNSTADAGACRMRIVSLPSTHGCNL
jgi:predicted RNase H-like nuclease (RuvC/YqgF family)